jgi:NAD+ synthetase
MKISLAQINPTVGDLRGNAAKIAAFSHRAESQGADLVLFPELALTGYPPEDLLLHPSFLKDCNKTLCRLAQNLPRKIPVLVGAPHGRPAQLYNGAALLLGGRVQAFFYKWLLPNYGVFDEKRYFISGEKPLVFKVRGVAVGVTLCEDIWQPGGSAVASIRQGAQLIVNLSSSPYHTGKVSLREKIVRKKIRECKIPLAYCNLVGGQDELVFDGNSFIMDAEGRIIAQAPAFQEHLLTVDMNHSTSRPQPLSHAEEIYSALVLATGDYVRKSGFKRVILGLSGGIDSSLVACIAVDALGKENVTGVTLPSRFNTTSTRSDAKTLAKNLEIPFHTIPIEPLRTAALKTLGPLFKGYAPDVTEENLQSRLRGLLLMALSNKWKGMVLTTGNKSETSVGYTTLYGDTAGGFDPLKDISKKEVYDLSLWRNKKAGRALSGRALIPQSVFKRPPTAELRPRQTDQDTLPPYDLLDKIIGLYVENYGGSAELRQARVNTKTAQKILRLIDTNEYKRRQSPPGPKLTLRAFGRDRRMPLVNRYHD